MSCTYSNADTMRWAGRADGLPEDRIDRLVTERVLMDTESGGICPGVPG